MEQINSLLDLTGKVAVVTGGGDGIGRGCALVLAAAGATVVVSNRTESKAATGAREITDSGGKALAAECDVAQKSHLKRLIDLTVETFGTVNILVNNAGHGGGGRENPCNIDFRRKRVRPLDALQAGGPVHEAVELREHHQHYFDEFGKQRPRDGNLWLLEGGAQSSDVESGV